MGSSRNSRLGFTLVELLVVIAIIGILIALLLPAIQAAREAARRSQCSNNLKQIGLALHNYHDTYKALPLGHIMSNSSSDDDYCRGSWIKGILPFMELENVYNQFDHNAAWWMSANQAVRGIKIMEFVCPSDVRVEIHNNSQDFGFRGNYAGNAGIGMYKRDYRPSEQPLSVRGPFAPNYSARFGDMADGTSNTAAVGEIRRVMANDSRGALFADSGTVQYTHDGLPNEIIDDFTERCVSKPQTPCTSGTANGPSRLTLRSNHPGGVQVLLFDGSVRFVSEVIDRATWQAAASMRGHEALQLP